MLTILSGPPGVGKTCLLTYFAVTYAFNRQRNRLMQTEIMKKIDGGFSSIKTIPPHCVSANYDIVMRKFGYTPRLSRRINPYRLGFKNPSVDVHFNLPYEAIFITEAQKYLNSRMSTYFPDWQSRWYEQHRHNDLDIFLDVQRPGLIDLNIRELSQCIDIMDLKIDYDVFGKPCLLKWFVRRIECGSIDCYIKSDKKDSSCYTEDIIVADFNVFACYDSQSCKPKFYEGHLYEDFDYFQADPPLDTFDSYVKYLKEFDDELPDNFYMKRGAK